MLGFQRIFLGRHNLIYSTWGLPLSLKLTLKNRSVKEVTEKLLSPSLSAFLIHSLYLNHSVPLSLHTPFSSKFINIV